MNLSFDNLVSDNFTTSEEITRYLQKNLIPLIDLEFLLPRLYNKISETAFFQNKLSEEKVRYETWNNNFKLIHHQLQEEGIPVVLIKSVDISPSLPYTSGNVDALIKKKDLIKVRTLLFLNGYIELKNIEEPQKFLFKKFHKDIAVSELHIHTQIGWGVCFVGDEVWNNKIHQSNDNEAVFLLSAEDQFLVHIAHAYYENKCVKLSDLIKFVHAINRIENWEYIYSIPVKYGWFDGFQYMLNRYFPLIEGYFRENIRSKSLISFKAQSTVDRSNPIPFPDAINFIHSKIYYYKKIRKDTTTSINRKVYETISTLLWGIELKLKIHSQNGFLIVISGIDGSGKTTQCEILKTVLQKCDLRYKYVWQRANNSVFTRIINFIGKRLFSDQVQKNTEGNAFTPDYINRRNLIKSSSFGFLWKWIILIEISLSYFIKISLPELFGKIIVCDRYFDDIIAELNTLYDQDLSKTTFYKVFKLLIPQPDLQIVLQVSDDVAHRRQRSNEESLMFLNEMNKYYKELIKSKNHYNIDSMETIEQVSDKIIRKALTSYYQKYSPTGKSLLLANSFQMNPVK